MSQAAVGEIFLGRYAELSAEQRVQIAPVNAHIIRRVGDADGIAIIVLDEFHGFADIQAAVLPAGRAPSKPIHTYDHGSDASA